VVSGVSIYYYKYISQYNIEYKKKPKKTVKIVYEENNISNGVILTYNECEYNIR